MRVITAPEDLTVNPNEISCFLAGGITNCPEWQDEVISMLKDEDNLVLFNPRRKNFPIHDPNASEEQIKWEFRALSNCDIFSMYFCAGESDQPICMYELGRNLAIRQLRKKLDNVIITVEPEYKREADVYIQTDLVSRKLGSMINDNIEEHVEDIRRIKNEILNKRLESIF